MSKFVSILRRYLMHPKIKDISELGTSKFKFVLITLSDYDDAGDDDNNWCRSRFEQLMMKTRNHFICFKLIKNLLLLMKVLVCLLLHSNNLIDGLKGACRPRSSGRAASREISLSWNFQNEAQIFPVWYYILVSSCEQKIRKES